MFLLLRNGVGKILGILRNFILVPVLTPELLGIYRQAITILSYGNLLHFGSVTHLIFNYGSINDSIDIKREVKSFALLGVYIGALLSFFFTYFLLTNYFFGVTRLLISLSAGLSIFSFYIIIFFRTKLEFSKMAKEDIILQIISFILFVFGGFYFGLPGYIIGSQVGNCYLIIKFSKELNPKSILIFKSKFRYFILPSLDLWVSSLINQLNISLDILLLGLILIDKEKFGFYAFGALFVSTINSVMGVIVEVKGQKLLSKYSETIKYDDKTKEEIVKEVMLNTERDAFFSVLFGLLSLSTLSIIIYFYLEKYNDSIVILFPFLLSLVYLRIRNYFALFLNKFGKSSFVSFSSFFGVLFLVLSILFIKNNQDISLYLLSFISFFTYVLVDILIVYYFFKQIGFQFRCHFNLKVFYITVPILLCALVPLFVSNYNFSIHFLTILIVLVGILPFLYLINKSILMKYLILLKSIKFFKI